MNVEIRMKRSSSTVAQLWGQKGSIQKEDLQFCSVVWNRNLDRKGKYNITGPTSFYSRVVALLVWWPQVIPNDVHCRRTKLNKGNGDGY